jgi:peptidoglycan-associated lipoprotein
LVPEGSSGGASRQTSRSTGYVDAATLADVHFDVDRAAIRPPDQSVLDANAAWLRANTGVRLLLEGHADERGLAAHNRALAERRAAAVRNALVARGVEASRIAIRTYGEERPVCSDRTDPCWAKNRRVHFLVKG